MSVTPSVLYSITVRLEVPPRGRAVSDLTHVVEQSGGAVTALDVTPFSHERLRVDLTCAARDTDHAEAIVQALSEIDGVQVSKVSDRTFLLHLGGKIETAVKIPLRNRDDLSMAYTPGVARVSMAIARNPEDVRRFMVKRNPVVVVTDGSAVLGLGNIGPYAAMPVMEGKAALFKRFAGIDAWPLCLDTQDTDEIVRTVQIIAPAFGGINLEDISAPRCFEVERRLRDLLDIPVFHDDQHGTAIVVLAALTNALRVVGKELNNVRVVLSGVGAAGTAVIRLLVRTGVGDVLAVDRAGIIEPSMSGLDDSWRWVAEHTNTEGRKGTLRQALVGADVFIGVSAPDLLDRADLLQMNPGAIVFALANPDPEIDPYVARTVAAVVATGRSDQPNQINNVLAFPGVFRGLLDAQARDVTDEMSVAAARAIACCVADSELNASYIIPSVFDEAVAPAVAAAVRAVVPARTGPREVDH
ncbi:MAG: NAD-dependent malic enzyme [Streptosporangiaceae bacterium]